MVARPNTQYPSTHLPRDGDLLAVRYARRRFHVNTSEEKNRFERRKFLTAAGAVGLGTMVVGVAAACGTGETATTTTGTGRGKSLKKVTFVTDVTPYGKHAPFFVALEKGFWTKRGLEVDIQSGKGSADAVTKVASGAGQFALADTSAVILARGNQGVAAKVVCMYHYKNLMCSLSLEGAGIREPRDLVGTNQHVTAGEGTYRLLPALAQLNGFDAKGVKATIGEFTQSVPILLSGRADGTLNYFTLYPALEAAAEKAGKKAAHFLYADYGLDIYNNGIVVTDAFAEKDPDAVRAFCDGFAEAIVYTVANPDEAMESFQKRVPGLDSKIARAQLQVAIDHLNVAEVKTKGFGPMSDDKMATTLEMVNKYFDLKTPVSVTSDVYTNKFVTAGQVPAL
jgi:NitT/TauT family transport system substrate-binding protein